MRNATFLALLPLVAAGCSSGSMTVDTGVTLQPGASAELTTTGDPATILLVRTADSRTTTDNSVVVLSGADVSKDSSGRWAAHTCAPLAAGATIVQGPDTASRRVVIVNSGDGVADVKIHITGGDGFKLIQLPPAAAK